MADYNALLLERQLCFPLYAASKEVVRRYRPYLEALDLTYTQYITLMVLWQDGTINVKALGDRLYLDSGTLTPLLKSLQAKGFITRHRSPTDERILLVSITDKGLALRDSAIKIPQQMCADLPLSAEEAHTLYALLYKVLGTKT